MGLLIGLSFLCYIPVVIWGDLYPTVGILMMPKTVAYLLIVVQGYRAAGFSFRLAFCDA